MAHKKYFYHCRGTQKVFLSCSHFSLYVGFSLILQGFSHFPILGELAYFGICQRVFPLKSCKIGCKTSPILQLYNSPNYISFSSLFECLQSPHAYKCSASRVFPLKSCKIGCKTSPILQLYNSPNYISFSSLFECLQSPHAYKCSASRRYPSAP